MSGRLNWAVLRPEGIALLRWYKIFAPQTDLMALYGRNRGAASRDLASGDKVVPAIPRHALAVCGVPYHTRRAAAERSASPTQSN
jgi:hypothetical protein